MSSESDPLVELAQKTIEEFVRTGRHASVPAPMPLELSRRAGAFVCLKKRGDLRGCIGTIEATCSNLAEEIVQNAVSAAAHDPRFPPLGPSELDELEYTVDVLGEPERIDGLEDLDPRVYGVIVESGQKRGLLLPDLEGVDTPEHQLSIALRKAGIYGGEPVRLYRFRVERHGK